MNNSIKRSATTWLLVILVVATSGAAIFRLVHLMTPGDALHVFRNGAIVEITAHIIFLLSAVSLFFLKKISFFLALIGTAFLLGSIWYFWGLSGLVWTFMLPQDLYKNLLPISLSVYTGILFYKNELS